KECRRNLPIALSAGDLRRDLKFGRAESFSGAGSASRERHSTRPEFPPHTLGPEWGAKGFELGKRQLQLSSRVGPAPFSLQQFTAYEARATPGERIAWSRQHRDGTVEMRSVSGWLEQRQRPGSRRHPVGPDGVLLEVAEGRDQR